MTPTELVGQLIGVFLAFCLFSFVFFKDNKFFNVAERFYIGGSIAYGLFTVYSSLKASAFDFIASGRILLLIPIALGLLFFARLSTNLKWLARYPTAILSGIGLGLVFGLTIRSQILTMITSTVTKLMVPTTAIGGDIGSALFRLVGMAAVLSYFLYSKTYSPIFHSPKGRLYWFMRLGRIFLMISVGYLAGGTVLLNYAGFLNTMTIVLIKRTVDAITFMFAG